MEVKELKNVFDSGGLKSAVVTPAYGTEGYEVILTTRKNFYSFYLYIPK